MSTLLYSPQIRVHVSTHGGGRRNAEIIDISDDLVQGSITLRTNAVHTFSFQLQNALRKYDGVMQPMDRIVVEMKRVTWVRVFSGYLNNGPVFSVWPRVLNFTASCTLKRLQFWYWDTTAPATVQLIQQSFGDNGGAIDQTPGPQSKDPNQPKPPATPTPPNQTTTPGAKKSDHPGSGVAGGDAQARELAVRMLKEVVGWPPEKVHIAEIPSKWFSMAQEIYQIVVNKAVIPDELIGDFTSGGTIGGTAFNSPGGGGASGPMGNGTLSAGTYGGVTLNQEQASNAATIYNVAAGRGLGPQAAVIAIATAMQESGLRNLNYGDRDSKGLFQQRPSQGWGTPAQVTDPVYASNKFYDALVKVPNWQRMPVSQAAQAVQRSAFPGAYAKHEPMARAVVTALSGSKGGAGGGAAASKGGAASGAGQAAGAAKGGKGAPAPAASTSGGGARVGSGRNMALVAANLIKSHPPGHIQYRLGGDSSYTDPDPRVLDCSSFVDWVYYHAIGRPLSGGRTTAASEQSMCKTIDVNTAKSVKGALLFIGSPAHHVEVSLGNGTTAAAHTDGIPLERQVTVSPAGNFTGAGLLPGVDYSDAATNQAAASRLSSIIGRPTSVSDPNETGPGTSVDGGAGGAAGAAGAAAGPDGNAAFNAFINVYTWGLKSTVAGSIFAGPAALMNDEPFLPWLSNLMATIMRSWCSAPNGDFIAWFPDYFGLWDSAAKMTIQSIELMDFTVDWYDQEIVTHQYVVGTDAAMFDSRTATVQAREGGAGSSSGLYAQATTSGIATMDFPEIFKAIFGIAASEQFLKDYLDRFGGRPNVINVPTLQHKSNAEFFYALYLFMQRWANQFRADVPMTFMPELWPGMLLYLPEFQFQAYIMEVTHTFQFGKGGGFKTRAKICAPARTSQKTDIFGLLPLSGSARTDGSSSSKKTSKNPSSATPPKSTKKTKGVK